MRKLLSILAAMALFTACAQEPMQDSTASELPKQETAYTFVDAMERTVTVTAPKKVGVAIGSFADVWQLAGGEVFAVTQDAYVERDFNLPTGLVDLGSTKAPNIEAMVKEGVDFLILSSKTKEHVDLSAQLDQMGINHAYFQVDYFSDYIDMLNTCTKITGNADMYKKNGTDVQEKIEKIISENAITENQPKVLFIRAFSTDAKAQSSKNMTGKMLEDLGCINIADSEGGVLENLSIENIIKEDPDYIFVVTMGESSEKALEVMKEKLTQNPAWSTLTAVKNDRYIILEKELFHYKPNARWGESYEILAEILKK